METLKSIKEKYPQYAALPDNVLADRIYNKHYKGVMDRKEFEYRIGARDLDYNFVDDMASGAMLSLDDEVEGLGRASGATVGRGLTGKTTDFGKQYDSSLDDYRLRQNIYREQNPKTSFAARTVGGMAVGGPTFSGIAQKYGPIVAGMATGGTMGAIEGFAGGEGGLPNRMYSAGVGGGLGTLLGGLIPAAITGGVQAIKGIKNAFGWVDVPDASVQRILKAMSDDGLTPDEMASSLEQLASAGKPGAIADMGDNLKSLGAYVSKQPGKGRTIAQDFVANRQMSQVDRLTDDVRKYVSPDDLYQSIDDLISKRSAASAPLYRKAYQKNFVWSDTLEGLLKRRPVQKALRNAVDIIETRGGNPKALGFDFNEAGDVIFNDTPSMEALDYIKRGMDDVIERYRDKTTGKLVLDERGRSFNRLLQDYKKELIKLNPDYGDALNAYSGPTRMMDIIERGRGYHKQHPEEIKRYIASLSNDERELYRIGVGQQMIDIANSRTHGSDRTKALLGSPQKEKALSVVFGGDENLKGLLDAFDAESRFHQTYSKVTGGSPTQPLQGEALAMPQFDFVSNIARGDIPAAVGSAWRSSAERLRGVNDRTAENISGLLFQSNPQALARTASTLTNKAATEAEKNAAFLGRLGLLTTPLSLQGGFFGRKRVQDR